MSRVAELVLPLATARDRTAVPPVRPVVQHFESQRVADIADTVTASVAAQLGAAGARGRIAVAVGSRGIASYAEVVRAIVRALRDAGAEPFVIPAMGSHGGGTVEGQTAVLHSLGMTEERIGAPIRATMDVVQTGQLADGTPIYTNAIAAEADGIVLVNRVKPHTAFRGPVESGLSKLLVAGLANTVGITALHARGIETFHELIPTAVELLVHRLPVLFGVALLENGYNQLAHVEVVPAAQLGTREPELLKRARALMPRLLFDAIDVLVLERIGKDISGPGFDPNVVGRNGRTCPVFDGPRIERIAAMSLSPGSLGNAGGMGPLDLITHRLLRAIDFEASYWNAIASTHLELAAMPMVARSGADAIALAVAAIHGRSLDQIRLVYARSTKHLASIYVSPALEDEVRAHPRLELAGPARPLLEGDEPFAFPEPADHRGPDLF
ncbi:MAG: nickel-dependent lactate racemase [Myxococcota bacterium]|nr:nickel-dependent lactate racemase [Myxococcota bacterium]